MPLSYLLKIWERKIQHLSICHGSLPPRLVTQEEDSDLDKVCFGWVLLRPLERVGGGEKGIDWIAFIFK
jgi:hypothetical protein